MELVNNPICNKSITDEKGIKCYSHDDLLSAVKRLKEYFYTNLDTDIKNGYIMDDLVDIKGDFDLCIEYIFGADFL